MRKTRIYLESSSIMMMGPDQYPIRQAITKEFFRIVAILDGFLILKIGETTLFSPYFSEQNNLSNRENHHQHPPYSLIFPWGRNKGIRGIGGRGILRY